MLNALIGRKVGMTQVFGDNGKAIPVTVIEAGPCTITQVKTVATDGYEAVQIGFGEKKSKHSTRAEMGHLGHALPPTELQKKMRQAERRRTRDEARQRGESGLDAGTEQDAGDGDAGEQETQSAPSQQGRARRLRRGRGLGPFYILREVPAAPGESPAVGQIIKTDIFSIGEYVDVIGTTKGKGFAGVMKRHGFKGGQRTHGQSDRLRAPGSIGAGTTPGRVLKGTRMAGHMGTDRRTIALLEVIQSDPERNLLVIKGSIPGANGGIIVIRKHKGR